MSDSTLDGVRVLVLGAGGSREGAFLRWARHGCRVTLVHGDESHGYEGLVDAFLPWLVHDDHDPDLAGLVALAKEHDVVLTLSEMAQETTATVAERAGLRGAGALAAALARDKHRQRERAGGAGLPAVACLLVTADDVGSLPAISLPVVVKPTDSGGSAAVSLVEHETDLAPALKRAMEQSVSGRAVIETFVPGDEWSVEAVVIDGVLGFTAMTDKQLVGPSCFVERRHVVGPVADEATRQLLDDSARAFVAMLGVDTAICHLEMRVHEGRVTPIEGAVRPGGGGVMELVRLAHGRDLYSELVAALAGRPVPPCERRAARFAGTEFLIATGHVTGETTPAVAAGIPGIRYVETSARPGTHLPPLEANWSRAGRAVATHDDYTQLTMALAEAIGRLGTAMGVTVE